MVNFNFNLHTKDCLHFLPQQTLIHMLNIFAIYKQTTFYYILTNAYSLLKLQFISNIHTAFTLYLNKQTLFIS